MSAWSDFMYSSPCPSSQTSKNQILMKINTCGSCHSSGSQSPSSHHGGLGSIPGQIMCYMQWTEWLWGRFSPSASVSPVGSHPTNCSIFIDCLIINAIWSRYWQHHLINKHYRSQGGEHSLFKEDILVYQIEMFPYLENKFVLACNFFMSSVIQNSM
jgi:hypothetical protein